MRTDKIKSSERHEITVWINMDREAATLDELEAFCATLRENGAHGDIPISYERHLSARLTATVRLPNSEPVRTPLVVVATAGGGGNPFSRAAGSVVLAGGGGAGGAGGVAYGAGSVGGSGGSGGASHVTTDLRPQKPETPESDG